MTHFPLRESLSPPPLPPPPRINILDVNLDGARAAIESFTPIVPASTGLVILVSSTVGPYEAQPLQKELRQLLTDDAASLTWPQLQALRDDWQLYLDEKPSRYQWTPRDVLAGSYSISKTLVDAYARMRCAQQPTPKLVLVCPGYCATDLTYGQRPDPPSKGAESVTWPLFHAAEAQHGHFNLQGVEQKFVQDAPQSYWDTMRKLAVMSVANEA